MIFQFKAPKAAAKASGVERPNSGWMNSSSVLKKSTDEARKTKAKGREVLAANGAPPGRWF